MYSLEKFIEYIPNIEKSNDPKFDWYFPKDNLYVTNDELLEIAVIMNYEPTIPMRIRKFINDFFKKQKS